MLSTGVMTLALMAFGREQIEAGIGESGAGRDGVPRHQHQPTSRNASGELVSILGSALINAAIPPATVTVYFIRIVYFGEGTLFEMYSTGVGEVHRYCTGLCEMLGFLWQIGSRASSCSKRVLEDVDGGEGQQKKSSKNLQYIEKIQN